MGGLWRSRCRSEPCRSVLIDPIRADRSDPCRGRGCRRSCPFPVPRTGRTGPDWPRPPHKCRGGGAGRSAGPSRAGPWTWTWTHPAPSTTRSSRSKVPAGSPCRGARHPPGMLRSGAGGLGGGLSARPGCSAVGMGMWGGVLEPTLEAPQWGWERVGGLAPVLDALQWGWGVWGFCHAVGLGAGKVLGAHPGCSTVGLGACGVPGTGSGCSAVGLGAGVGLGAHPGCSAVVWGRPWCSAPALGALQWGWAVGS